MAPAHPAVDLTIHTIRKHTVYTSVQSLLDITYHKVAVADYVAYKAQLHDIIIGRTEEN